MRRVNTFVDGKPILSIVTAGMFLPGVRNMRKLLYVLPVGIFLAIAGIAAAVIIHKQQLEIAKLTEANANLRIQIINANTGAADNYVKYMTARDEKESWFRASTMMQTALDTCRGESKKASDYALTTAIQLFQCQATAQN